MADTLDVLTEAESLAAINTASLSATLTTKLATFVTGISRRFDEVIGPVVVRSVIERHSPDGCQTGLLLRDTPVSSITTVVEWSTDGTSTALTAETDASKPADGFLLNNEHKHRPVLLRRSAGTSTAWLAGDSNIVVTYVAGRAATTAAVDAEIKLQAQDILAFQWQQAAPVWAQSPDADPEGVPSFLAIDEVIRRRMKGETPALVG